jgi:hypothetical protein
MIAITPWILLLVAAHQDPTPPAPEPAQSTPAQTPIGPPPAPVSPDAQDEHDASPAKTPTQEPGLEGSDASKTAASDDKDKSMPEGPEWFSLDGVAIIINQNITTKSDVDIEYFRQYRDKPVSDADEQKRRYDDLVADRIERTLAMQAGQDMGASEELIAQQVNDRFEHFVQARGGIVETTKWLEHQRETTQDLRRDIREVLFVRLWRDWITGEGSGVGKRPEQDRFVRPGELKFRFNQLVQDPGKFGMLGGTAETVTLQSLLLDPVENGGMDKTNALARDLRRRILDGDDMHDLVLTYGKSKNDIIKDVTISDLGRQHKSMARFADKAQIDEVSEPMPFKAGTGQTFVQIVRLVEKKAGVRPQLASPEVQKTMTKGMQTERDEIRLRLAYDVLYEASYVWPPRHNERPPK